MTTPCRTLLLACFVMCSGLASQALATFHEWRFAEFYSNPSGTVQFLEMADDFAGETFLAGQTLQSGGHLFTFPSNLPAGTPTAGHRLLLATPGYFDLRGVPPADYNLGTNNFFNVAGDTLTFAAGLDSITITAGQLPLDGLHSLVRTTPETGSPVSTAVNSPTNVAGTSGTFPRWENQDNRFNVNGVGAVTLQDIIIVINDLLANGTHLLPEPGPGAAPPPYYDVTGDNRVSLLDALQLINHVLAFPTDGGSASGAPAFGAAMTISVPEPSGTRLALCGVVVLAGAVVGRRLKRAIQSPAKIL